MSDLCIVCESTKTKDSLAVKDHLVSQEVFTIVTCQDCGMRYVQDPPPPDQAYRYYETEEYIEHSDTTDGWINSIYHRARDLMLRYKHRMIRSRVDGRRILDFGTGTGYFLHFMQSRGYEVTGVEISAKARDFGHRRFGLEIRPPENIYDDGFLGGYDVITFWHVLEHVYEPYRILKRLRSLLSPGGLIFIALPNHKSVDAAHFGTYWSAYDVPRHLWHFDADSMQRFAERCGYDVIETKLVPLDPFYNSLISSSFRNSKLALLTLPFVATYALVRGVITTEKASSIIYILKAKANVV